MEEGFQRGDQAAGTSVVNSVLDGVELLKRVEQSDSIGIAEAAKLLGRVLRDRRTVVIELVQQLNRRNSRFIAPPSGRLRSLITWANDARRSWSMLRHEVAAGLHDFISAHQVQLPLDRTLLYVATGASGTIAELQAFGAWFGCWDVDISACQAKDQLFGVHHSWQPEDDVIAEIVIELHRAFRRGAEGEFELDLFSIAAMDYPLIVRDARHVVASIWMQLRPVPISQLRRYLAELREAAAVEGT
ncbi:hypothetical protein J2X20_003321 [Pelomonas saccharophila]|uniref:Uncharacterized protein n=1 Tax=Roseateles saccharophilus TaxID=304 RepID=A0ABU1YP71_ROSSA|nr:hypothetical protein [Roseateles saccharophilus]MDR7270663.1 hypothetical protein [Roseateles saccharophilus]